MSNQLFTFFHSFIVTLYIVKKPQDKAYPPNQILGKRQGLFNKLNQL